MSRAFFDERFRYDDALPDTSNAWEDLLDANDSLLTFSPGDYSVMFLAGLGSDAFQVRTVQGCYDESLEEYQWFIVDDALSVLASRAAGDGVVSQIGNRLCKLQVQTAGAITRATIVVNARWGGK